MNAEIVDIIEKFPAYHRLSMDVSYLKMENERLAGELASAQAALQAAQEENDSLRDRAERALQRAADTTVSWEDWATRQFTDENTLYVVLDADGHPQSWDEIITHLQAISEASGGAIERIEAGVFDAPKEQNDKRFEQWMKLREFYRSKRQKKNEKKTSGRQIKLKPT